MLLNIYFCFLFCFKLGANEQVELDKIAEHIKNSQVFPDCTAPNINCGNSNCYGNSCGNSFTVQVENGTITRLFVF